MIRILHLLPSLGRGGAERALADLVIQADRERFEHRICYLHGPHDLADELRDAGFDPIHLNAPSHRSWFAAARALRPVIEAERPDILQSVTFDANLAARIAARGTGLPLLAWLVSMEYDASVRAAGWSRTANFGRRLIDSWSARLTGTSFVACSESVRHSAMAEMGIATSRIETIYNPVSLENLEAAPGEAASVRRELALPEDSFVYLTVGRIDAAKGQHLLLAAFAEVHGEQPNAHLVIVGSGPREEELRREAEALGIADRVRFAGKAPRIAPYFAIADAFVFPSLLEGLPVALLEAMCAGLPAIASDIEPHVEVVEPGVTGLLSAANSPAAIAREMRRLHSDPELRARIGAAARETARRQFSTSAILPRWGDLYERLATVPRRSPA